MAAKRAQLIVDAFAVCCPYCGEPQPCANGSELWTRDDFRGKAGERECVSCGETMSLNVHSRVQFADDFVPINLS